MPGTLLEVWDLSMKETRFLPCWDLHSRSKRARNLGRRNYPVEMGRHILGMQHMGFTGAGRGEGSLGKTRLEQWARVQRVLGA